MTSIPPPTPTPTMKETTKEPTISPRNPRRRLPVKRGPNVDAGDAGVAVADGIVDLIEDAVEMAPPEMAVGGAVKVRAARRGARPDGAFLPDNCHRLRQR